MINLCEYQMKKCKVSNDKFIRISNEKNTKVSNDKII